MAHAEESKETFRILQQIIKQQDRSGITRLDVPTHDAEGVERVNSNGSQIMETISDPARVEELLLERNKKHFKQAEGTPFTTQALNQLFGTDEDSTTTEDLVNGILPPINHLPPTVHISNHYYENVM